MKRFGDFILVDKEALKKSAKTETKMSTLEKAKMIKEKLADPNEFMNDKPNDATEKAVPYTNKSVKKTGMPDPLLMSYNDQKKAKDAKKNDPAVSGTKVEGAVGEMGNKQKANDKSISPAVSEEKKDIAKPMKKSMAEGGLEWSQDDVTKGYLAYAGVMNTGVAAPNPNAQPLVKKEEQTKQEDRSVSLVSYLEQMDDSKVQV